MDVMTNIDRLSETQKELFYQKYGDMFEKACYQGLLDPVQMDLRLIDVD